jgi:23S rRNA pseudouridine1911/1915/1917 synthase
MQEIKATLDHAGKRADVFVAENYPEFTRSSLERLFDNDMVTVSGRPVKAAYRLKGTETLKVDETKLRVTPEPIDLPIIYEDDNVIVINKPEGVLTHSKGALNDEATIASFIKPKLNDNDLTGNRAGVVHRLDRGTSGIIIAAKNSTALTKLQKQFSQRKTKKTYLAIVEREPAEKEAIIDAPIERNPRRPQTFKVGAGGKPAATYYKVLKSFTKNGKPYSLIELKPTTGRTHQIRVHLAYIGHPVFGDKIYGTPADHLYLHAASLEITLPGSQRQTFTSQPPEYFDKFIV